MESLSGAGLPSISSMLPMPRGTVDTMTNVHRFARSPRQKPEESASQSLHTLLQVEEQRLRREEQRTRQETLKLDQRRIEQNMLRDAFEAGVPPHLIPLIFMGDDEANYQTYAAMLDHTSHERTTSNRMISHSSVSSHQFPTSSLRNYQLHPTSSQRPRYSSPPATIKGRACSVADVPYRNVPKSRSYSFVDNGASSTATSMAPPGSRLAYSSRPSFSAAPFSFEQPSKPSASSQLRSGPPEHYASHRQSINVSSSRSHSVSDAHNKQYPSTRNGGTSAAPQRSINFCHWRPPTETKQSSKSPGASQASAQQPPANEKLADEGTPAGGGKRKASYEPSDEAPPSRKKSVGLSLHDASSRHLERLDTGSERHDSVSVDGQSPAEEVCSPGASGAITSLPVDAAHNDPAAKSPHSEPLDSGSKRSAQRKRQEKSETSGGKMNIRFVDGLTPQRGLPNSRNYIIDSTALSSGTEDMPSSNGLSGQQQFAFVAGYSMARSRENSPPVGGALHDLAARRGSLPV